MVSDFTSGILLSLSAAILFGVHTSFSKTKSVIESGVAMPIYNIYFLFGAAIVNIIEFIILIIMGASIQFTYLGIICAILLLCFETFLLLSIQQIGVGYATGFSVFSCAVITPILQVIVGQPIAIVWVMVIGLIMLAFSVFLMSILRDALKCCGVNTNNKECIENDNNNNNGVELQMDNDNNNNNNNDDATEVSQIAGSHIMGNELAALDEHTPLISNNNNDNILQDDNNQEMKISRCSMIIGLVYSSLAGIFMAVLPLPSLYAEEGSAGLNFFLSFGVGCLIVMPLSAVIAVFTAPTTGSGGGHGTDTLQNGEKGQKTEAIQSVIPYNLIYKLISFDNEVWHFKEVVIPAVSAGIVWGIGNICGFCSFLYLSYTIAVSFVQCNVIVAMFLGVVLWKEITNKIEISILAFLSLVLVAGCAVVVYGVFGSF